AVSVDVGFVPAPLQKGGAPGEIAGADGAWRAAGVGLVVAYEVLLAQDRREGTGDLGRPPGDACQEHPADARVDGQSRELLAQFRDRAALAVGGTEHRQQ